MDNISVKTKKGKRGQSTGEREDNKKLKYSGEAHKSSDGKELKHKNTFSVVLNCCKEGCGNKVSANDQEVLFCQFFKSASKEIQDTLLSGFMRSQTPKTREVGASKSREVVWKYLIIVQGVEKSVCRRFILTLFQISEKRIRIIQQKVLAGESFTEKRGTHANRPQKISSEVWDLAKEHLGSIPSRESHYSRKKSKKRYFENPNLNTTKLYNDFLHYYKEKTGKSLKLNYRTYHKFFLHEMNYGYIVPRTDMCDYCAECLVKLKSNPNDVCKIQHEIHCRKSKAFKDLKSDLIKRCSEQGTIDKILFLEFDYAQNLPLPKTNESAQFYRRLLWVYLFNIHCHNDGSSALYYFLETEGKKNPESVCSFLYNFIKEKTDTARFNEIYLVSDSTGGQNRNKMMATFCSWLAMTLEIPITHIFPVVGHSFGQCDRNFGVYGSKLKIEEKIHNLEKYVQILTSARTNPSPFILKNGAPLMKNWYKGFENVISKKIVSKRHAFKIMSYCRIRYPSTGGVLVASSYFGGFQPFSYFKKQEVPNNLYETLLPAEKLQINPAKEKDIRFLFRFLSEGDVKWFEGVFEQSKLSTMTLTEDEENIVIFGYPEEDVTTN